MINGEKFMDRPLRWGMIGGGKTSGVGYKHRTGAQRDATNYQLVAGAFDIDEERGRSFGVNLGVTAERCYADYHVMLEEESKREDGIEVVSIALPNGLHYEATKKALEAGLHVICEKPLFFTSEEGEKIKKLAEEKGKIVGVTYGFSGNQMLLQMRDMIAEGAIGEVTMVELQYTHGYGADPEGDTKNPSQQWRVNPKISGDTFVIGDLSTHTIYMSQLILPELKIDQLLCMRQSFIESRKPLEDNAYVLMKYDTGAVGRVWTSAVNCGCIDGHRIRIVGTKASLEWWDAIPYEVSYEIQGKPIQKLIRGSDYLLDACKADERLGVLHVEGLSDAWANVYRKIALAIHAKNSGDEEALSKIVYPDIDAGINGIKWIENCVKSSNQGSVWVDFE